MVAIVPLVLALAGCARAPEGGVLHPAGPIAALQRDHMLIVVGLMAVVIVPIFIGLPWVLWRYRFSRKEADYRPDWDFDWRIEWVIWGVPALVVAGLAVALWINIHRIDPYRPIPPAEGADDGSANVQPLAIQAIGLDWKWLFIYPDQGIATVDEVVVPAGRDIAFDLTSDGPMMSFLVPQLGGQIYAMAGMRTKLHLEADRPGRFRGLNTQYNGTDFYRQQFTVRALPPAQYAAWVKGAHRGPALDAARYAQLAKPSVVAQPLTFGAVAPDLFARVMRQYRHAPAAHGIAAPAGQHPPHHEEPAQ